MATGELRTAMAFTEPSGGTDLLGAMRTSAKKVDDGWIIQGEKVWSTTANTADYLLVIAQTDKNPKKRSEASW